MKYLVIALCLLATPVFAQPCCPVTVSTCECEDCDCCKCDPCLCDPCECCKCGEVAKTCPNPKCECEDCNCCKCDPCLCDPCECCKCDGSVADQAYLYYDRLCQSQADTCMALREKLGTVYNRIQRKSKQYRESVNLESLEPHYIVGEALMKKCADLCVECQLQYNTSVSDVDKLRAAAKMAQYTRYWLGPVDTFSDLLKQLEDIERGIGATDT